MNPVITASLAGVALLLIVAVWQLRRRRKASSVREVLAAIAIERLEDVVVPDGNEGEIHIEHLLLTARGVLLVNVKHYEGVVFAGDRLDQWSAIGPAGRVTFNNPLPSLYDRVAAVRQLVTDINVTGYVVFPSSADFSKGRPADVVQPDELLQAFGRPDKLDVTRLRDAYSPVWDVLKRVATTGA